MFQEIDQDYHDYLYSGLPQLVIDSYNLEVFLKTRHLEKVVESVIIKSNKNMK